MCSILAFEAQRQSSDKHQRLERRPAKLAILNITPPAAVGGRYD